MYTPISLNEQKYEKITLKIFLQKMIRYNFEQQHTIYLRKYKMKFFRILIINAHRMSISNMLQCMHLCIFILHVPGVDQKYFWIWSEITHCSAIY